MSILITGGAGFIGSDLTGLLIEDNEIVCVDNINSYYNQQIKFQNIASYRNHKNYTFLRADIENKKILDTIFKKHDVKTIIHLAAQVGVRNSIHNPALYARTNILGTLNLLELARDYKVKKFIFASSSSVYGDQEKYPFSESVPVNKPISPYAATKIAGEQLCYTYSYLYSIPIVCLRFFTVYGPRQRPDLAIHSFTRLIDRGLPIPMYGDGSTQRDYTYIDDIIQGIKGAMSYKDSEFEIINLGENQTVRLSYIVTLIERELNKKAIIKKLPLQNGDMKITFADITKAKKLLNYCPTTKITEGIRKFVDWYKSNKY